LSEAEAKKEPWLIESRPIKPEYAYTKEENNYIDQIRAKEEIRGAKIRWWDDVKVGDELQPVTNGPFTAGTAARIFLSVSHCGSDFEPRGKPLSFLLDPVTNAYIHGCPTQHISSTIATRLANSAKEIGGGHPQAVPDMCDWWCLSGRLLTNWMGDDGFLKHWAVDQTDYEVLGDTAISKGRVVKKYVLDDGEHVVDIACWSENLRGYINKFGRATVGLLSKESLDKDLTRYVK
jgi:hypothetical protein